MFTELIHSSAVIDPSAKIGQEVKVHPFAIIGRATIGDKCVIGPYVQIDDDVCLGSETCVWNGSHVQRGAQLGRACVLGQNVNIGNNVLVGDFCKIQNNVNVYEGVRLGNFVFCGPSMTFTNILEPRCKHPQRGSTFYGQTIVADGATFGAHVTVVCGSRERPRQIGHDAMIAAGAIVTKDIPPNQLWRGTPARHVGWACEHGVVRRKMLWEGDVTVFYCEQCNRTFPLL